MNIINVTEDSNDITCDNIDCDDGEDKSEDDEGQDGTTWSLLYSRVGDCRTRLAAR